MKDYKATWEDVVPWGKSPEEGALRESIRKYCLNPDQGFLAKSGYPVELSLEDVEVVKSFLEELILVAEEQLAAVDALIPTPTAPKPVAKGKASTLFGRAAVSSAPTSLSRRIDLAFYEMHSHKLNDTERAEADYLVSQVTGGNATREERERLDEMIEDLKDILSFDLSPSSQSRDEVRYALVGEDPRDYPTEESLSMCMRMRLVYLEGRLEEGANLDNIEEQEVKDWKKFIYICPIET